MTGVPRVESCVILLGASLYPRYPELNHPSLHTSAMALKDYFLCTPELNVQPSNFLDLFESQENNTRQMELMGDHIDRFGEESEGSIQNVFIIYLGHGLPRAGLTDLSIRATTKRDVNLTALKVQELADQIKKLAAWSRRILILDCCYAAGTLQPWLDGDGGLAKTTEQAFETCETHEVRDEPTRGTTVLCASDKYSRAKAPLDETYTLFSGLLIEVLRKGKLGGPNFMTLENVAQIVSDKLRKRGDGPIPVLVSPDTTEGNLGSVLRLFPNPARKINPVTPPAVADSKHVPVFMNRTVLALVLCTITFVVLGIVGFWGKTNWNLAAPDSDKGASIASPASAPNQDENTVSAASAIAEVGATTTTPPASVQGDSYKQYLTAAYGGDAHAQFMLGQAYERGDGVDRDLYEAVTWYRKAAAQHNGQAEVALSRLKQVEAASSPPPGLRPKRSVQAVPVRRVRRRCTCAIHARAGL